MALHSVAGTGHENRAIGIRKWCKEGMNVILARESDNKFDSNAVAIHIPVKMLFGLIKTSFQIGYLKAAAAEKIAKRLDSKEKYIATVTRVYCPDWNNWPEVTIDVIFTKK